MCGRFNFTAEESDDIKNIIEEINRRHHSAEYKTREIFPANAVPILKQEDDRLA